MFANYIFANITSFAKFTKIMSHENSKCMVGPKLKLHHCSIFLVLSPFFLAVKSYNLIPTIHTGHRHLL